MGIVIAILIVGIFCFCVKERINKDISSMAINSANETAVYISNLKDYYIEGNIEKIEGDKVTLGCKNKDNPLICRYCKRGDFDKTQKCQVYHPVLCTTSRWRSFSQSQSVLKPKPTITGDYFLRDVSRRSSFSNGKYYYCANEGSEACSFCSRRLEIGNNTFSADSRKCRELEWD